MTSWKTGKNARLERRPEMAIKPETRFIASVNRRLPLKRRRESAAARQRYGFAIHYEKMANPWSSGAADCWYSGRRDLWVEYKYLPRLPARADIRPERLLSAQQLDWLSERAKEGRNVCVIIGCPEGGAILAPQELETAISLPAFKARTLTPEALARRLIALIEGESS